MANTSGYTRQSKPRRRFMKWVGQATAGASLAALGLGLANSKAAWAKPDCTPCSGCVVVSCSHSGKCPANTPNLITYELKQGCIEFGCTYSSYYYECHDDCTCSY